MEKEGQQVAMENLEVIKVNPGECTPERIVEQTDELAESFGEAGVTKSVGAAQHFGFAKKMDDVPLPTKESLEVGASSSPVAVQQSAALSGRCRGVREGQGDTHIDANF